jgi:peroxiredoxin
LVTGSYYKKEERRVPERKQWSGVAETGSSWFRFALALGMLGVVGLSTIACDRGDHPTRIGSKAPEFRITDGRESLDLDNLRGRVVVLNFWATSCVPCIEEIPTLVELHRRMPNISVVAVSSDDDDGLYRRFLTQYNVSFLTVRDPSYRIPHMYGTVKIPETYVIDRDGVLRRKFVSAQDWTSPEILDYLSKL